MKTLLKLMLLLVTLSLFTACCPLFYPYGEYGGYYHRDNRYYHHDNRRGDHGGGYYNYGDRRDRDEDRN